MKLERARTSFGLVDSGWWLTVPGFPRKTYPNRYNASAAAAEYLIEQGIEPDTEEFNEAMLAAGFTLEEIEEAVEI